MLKLLWTIPLIATLFLLSSCEGHYRYPCQDPDNWHKEECNNDVCKAEGECTDDVLGRNSSPFGSAFPDQTESSDTCGSQLSTDENIADDEYVTKTHSAPGPMLQRLAPQELFADEDIPARTPNTLFEEDFLSMNTMVDTAAHDAATM